MTSVLFDRAYDHAGSRTVQYPIEIAAGTTDSPDYQEATLVFYRRHVCRVDPVPAAVRHIFDWLGRHPEVYHTMNGPSECHVFVTLKAGGRQRRRTSRDVLSKLSSDAEAAEATAPLDRAR